MPGDLADSKASVKTELDFRDDEATNTDLMYSAGAGAAVGGGAVIAAVALGASLGSVVPVVGTLIGAVIGAAAGIGIYALAHPGEASAEEVQAREDSINSIKGSIDAIDRIGKAGRNFDDAMTDLNKIRVPGHKRG